MTRLAELNWDFHGDRSDSPFSDLHFHPGRFVPQIPAALIGSLTAPGALVLDPFCGAGTTLVEAQRMGRSAIGIDLNPVSCLTSRVKTLNLPASEIEERLLTALNDLTAFRLGALSAKGEVTVVPSTVQLSKWYHPETGQELSRIWAFVCRAADPLNRDLLLFCFSASLMTCCAETRSWGYVCDNVRPLERRYVDADAAFRAKVEALADAYRTRDRRRLTPLSSELPTAKVVQGDAAQHLAEIRSASINLVITSPPYFGVVDYIKSQRLTLEWLELPTEGLRLNETGARSKRHRATAFDQYIGELGEVARQLHRVLIPDGSLAMVIGESGRREAVLPRVPELLREAGFTPELIVNRRIGLRRRQPATLTEELLIVARKTAGAHR